MREHQRMKCSTNDALGLGHLDSHEGFNFSRFLCTSNKSLSVMGKINPCLLATTDGWRGFVI